MDYQWRITPMVVAQVGDLPDRGYKTLNIVAGMHTMHPGGGIRKTVQAFCEKYATHINKEVHYFLITLLLQSDQMQIHFMKRQKMNSENRDGHPLNVI
jgi:hypothetical protein